MKKQITIIQSLILISVNLFSQTDTIPFVEEVGRKFDYQEYK
jgi:hypothetical protein